VHVHSPYDWLTIHELWHFLTNRERRDGRLSDLRMPHDTGMEYLTRAFRWAYAVPEAELKAEFETWLALAALQELGEGGQ
jgi:hypothetical protein